MIPLVIIATALFGCEEKASEININSFNIYITEDLETDNKPVCLKWNISSDNQFDNSYLLEHDVSIQNNNILIAVNNIINNGKCEYPPYLSTPEPDNYQCPARTNYFTSDNLKRGLYTIEINLLGNTFYGQLKIYDQYATIFFNNSDVSLYDTLLHIVPDSCIFGTYYSINSDSAGFQDMINKLLTVNCRHIDMEPGQYRAFEIDSLGRPIIGSTQDNSGSTFILKYDLDIDKIITTLNNFITNSNDAYGVIFKDNLGNYYNIKNKLALTPYITKRGF